MYISKEVDYAYRTIIYLGINQNKFISRKELSEKEEIPFRYLKEILKKLFIAKIIITKIGKKGGYQLNLTLDKITLFSILIAINGEVKLKECIVSNKICDFRSGKCIVHSEFKKIDKEIKNRLDKITFEKLLLR